MLKIYFENTPVTICGKKELNHKENPLQNQLIIEDPGELQLKNFLKEIQNQKSTSGTIICTDPEKIKQEVFRMFNKIVAGGGVIENENHQILMIFRRGKWDLPKGKLDEGETIEQCAIREIREETGLEEISITKMLMITYHTYIEKKVAILKETHWYKMLYSGKQTPIPQAEEQITQIEWAYPDKMDKYFDNTYDIIKEIIQDYKGNI